MHRPFGCYSLGRETFTLFKRDVDRFPRAASRDNKEQLHTESRLPGQDKRHFLRFVYRTRCSSIVCLWHATASNTGRELVFNGIYGVLFFYTYRVGPAFRKYHQKVYLMKSPVRHPIRELFQRIWTKTNVNNFEQKRIRSTSVVWSEYRNRSVVY